MTNHALPMDFRLRIHFDVYSPRIEEQLKEQGLKLDLSLMKRLYLQKDADDVTRLRVRCILTKVESDKAYNRIFKIIKKHAKPL